MTFQTLTFVKKFSRAKTKQKKVMKGKEKKTQPEESAHTLTPQQPTRKMNPCPSKIQYKSLSLLNKKYYFSSVNLKIYSVLKNNLYFHLRSIFFTNHLLVTLSSIPHIQITIKIVRNWPWISLDVRTEGFDSRLPEESVSLKNMHAPRSCNFCRAYCARKEI